MKKLAEVVRSVVRILSTLFMVLAGLLIAAIQFDGNRGKNGFGDGFMDYLCLVLFGIILLLGLVRLGSSSPVSGPASPLRRRIVERLQAGVLHDLMVEHPNLGNVAILGAFNFALGIVFYTLLRIASADWAAIFGWVPLVAAGWLGLFPLLAALVIWVVIKLSRGQLRLQTLASRTPAELENEASEVTAEETCP